MSDLKGGPPADWIVCGWFTEDAIYRPLAEQLAASLDAVGAPYDLVPASTRAGGHQANTMAKAGHVLAAMDRHPNKIIIFSDVDCTVRGDLTRLLDTRGDIAFRLLARRRKTGSAHISVRSGYIVIRPTAPARRFVEAWQHLSETDANWGDVDQTTLALTLGQPHGASIGHLDDAVIRSVFDHIAASKIAARKIKGWQREGAYLLRSIARTLLPITYRPKTPS